MGLAALKQEDLPHYTYSDYSQWEGKWELIKGIPYAMTPAPGLLHQRLSAKLAYLLERQMKKCSPCSTYMPVDWQITDDTIVQPDLLVACGAEINEKKLTVPPVVVFEILSPSTARKDKILKYELYQAAGVKYYCMIEPEEKSVVVFVLQQEEFTEAADFQGMHMTFDLGPCTISINFHELFENL